MAGRRQGYRARPPTRLTTSHDSDPRVSYTSLNLEDATSMSFLPTNNNHEHSYIQVPSSADANHVQVASTQDNSNMTGQIEPSRLCQDLASEGLPKPTETWLQAVIASQRASVPYAAILAIVKLRLLSTDLSAPGVFDNHTPALPRNVSDPSVQSLKLSSDIIVQILDVEDLSKSRWEQIEAIEAVERGDMVRGREVIRIIPEENNEGDDESQPGNARGGGLLPVAKTFGPHRLVLQDCQGQRVYGIEVKSVPKIGLGMDIGSKLVLKKGCEVARGMVMLSPHTVLFLGGKIEALHKSWQANRKKDLKAAIESSAA